MITSSSISYVSQMLDSPQNISDADMESINNLKEAYPYFVPARYLEAANRHIVQPFSNEMMEDMLLFQGNWLLYNEFLQHALGDKEVDVDVEISKTQPKRDISAEAKKRVEEEEELLEEEVHQEDIATEEPVAEEQQTGAEEEELVTEAELEEDVIAKENTTTTPQSEKEDFVPQNTGFVTGKEAPKPKQEQPPVVEETVQEEPPFIEEEVIVAEEQEEVIAAEEEKEQQDEDSNDKNENLIPPVYTEDYFLHQGMHVSNNIPDDLNKGGTPIEIPDDEKSLMVVMSFAEWLSFYKKKKQAEEEEENDQKVLKSMWQREKLAAALEEENDEIPENVFEMAVNSITKEDALISESLAEVLVRQGRYDRAIDMYKKLSLRKPQKKAYFARKIEEILKEK